jgi:flagellar protein FliO/FliZ
MGMMLLRLAASLFFVVVVLALSARLAKRRGFGAPATGLVEVLARQQMTRSSAVNVVRVADRVFVVGCTESQVSVLGEVDPGAVAEHVRPALVVPREAREGVERAVQGKVSASSSVVTGSLLDFRQWGRLVRDVQDRTVRRA